MKYGFWLSIVSGIPDSLSWIPYSKTQDSGFHKEKFPGFRNMERCAMNHLLLFCRSHLTKDWRSKHSRGAFESFYWSTWRGHPTTVFCKISGNFYSSRKAKNFWITVQSFIWDIRRFKLPYEVEIDFSFTFYSKDLTIISNKKVTWEFSRNKKFSYESMTTSSSRKHPKTFETAY